MNLHSLAGPIVAAVNPTTTGTVLLSEGYMTGRTGKREPVYRRQHGVAMQVQALTGPELRQVEGLAIQGTMRGVYLYGDIEAVSRPREKGGDLLSFDGRTWQVVRVLETWPGWCKVVVVEQLGALPC